MKLDWDVEFAGLGAAIPTRVIDNAYFEARIDTSDEWIVQRSGIHERRWTQNGESTLSLSVDCSRQAIADAGLEPKDIDLIIVATVTPEHTLPSTSCELQAALGCGWCQAYDIGAACSGFIYAAQAGAQHVQLGTAKNVLVVGVECMTRITDMEDRSTCVLFGDGAAAAVLRWSTNGQKILGSIMGADGGRAMTIYIPAGGAAEPASLKTVNERLHFMRMQGREVYKFAVMQFYEIVRDTLAQTGTSIDDLKLLVPHQSNLRIIESAAKRLELPMDRVLINIDKRGNMSAASVPTALWEARQAGRFQPGDLIMLVAFGAGLTWGSLLLRM